MLREFDDLTKTKLTTWKIRNLKKQYPKIKDDRSCQKTQNDESGKPILSAKKTPKNIEMSR